jgi:hypothetical protein
MALSIESWLDQYSAAHVRWLLKRLSANDTQQTGGHQAGFYIPRQDLFREFPALDRPEKENPKVIFDLYLDSHDEKVSPVVTWYNNKLRGGTRNETRVTRLGGSASPLLDERNTGSLILMAFLSEAGPACKIHLWICSDQEEEQCVEDRWGPVEPGQIVRFGPGQLFSRASELCGGSLLKGKLPSEWCKKFPSAGDIFDRALELASRCRAEGVDSRLIERRKLELALFSEVEEAVELPLFMDLANNNAPMEKFLEKAKSIVNRRKSRSGLSLERHVRQILGEEGLAESKDYDYQPTVDSKAKPDFIFPSTEAYLDNEFPACNLRVLAVKTTCKDRWRQVLKEADRVPTKHLLTLQQGVSTHQFREMEDASLRLVVPTPLHKHYSNVSNEVLTLEEFIEDVQGLRFDS